MKHFLMIMANHYPIGRGVTPYQFILNSSQLIIVGEQLNERQQTVLRHVLNHAVELSKHADHTDMNALSKLAFIYSGLIGDIDMATHFVTLCGSNICELLKAKTDTDRKTVLHMA